MAEEKKSKGILATAAEALGAAAGSVASMAGPSTEKTATEKTATGKAAPEQPAPEKPSEKPEAKATPTSPRNERVPKLTSKNKTRLPRKEKKALQTKTALAKAKNT